MYREIKSNIEKLSRKIVDLDAAVRRENRSMTAAESRLRSEILDHVAELQRQLPQRLLTGQSGAYVPSDGPFGSLGEQMQAVMRAGIPGQETDQKLYQVRATGLSETVPAEGGFLVQAEFSNEMLEDIFRTGIIASRCRRVEIASNSNRILIPGIDETSRVTGSRYGGIQAYWEDEAAEKTASKPKFRKIDLILKKLIGLCYATDELLDDAPALEKVIREGFASEFGFMVDDAIINGVGGGMPLGVLQAQGQLVQVQKEKGQSSSTIQGTIMFENVMNMYARLLPGSYANAVWLINQNVLPSLYQMSMAVGTGGVPVFLPANSVAGVPYNSLFGLPILVIEQCQAPGSLGDIILGDFKNGYILAEKGGVKADLSIHVRLKKLTPHTVMYVENSVNSGKPHKLGNPEPSLSEKTASAMSLMLLGQEGATTIPYGSTSQANGDGSAEHPLTKDDDIVCSARRLAAVHQDDLDLANPSEHKASMTNQYFGQQQQAALNSNVKMNSSLIRGSLNSREHGNPEPSKGFMPWACVETIQEPTYLRG